MMTYETNGIIYPFYNALNSQYGWPVERKISKVLHEIAPQYLFDYPFGLTPKHQVWLVELFYLKYGHRQIGDLFEETFKNWVKARYYEIWDCKYKKLYLSKDIVKNPFITMIINKGNSKNNVINTKNSSNSKSSYHILSNEKHDNYNIETNSGTNNELSFSNNREEQTSKDIEEQKTASSTKQNETIIKRFTDTPQGKTLGNIKDKDGNNVPWNNGYLTTGEQDDTTEGILNNTHTGNSKVNYSDNKKLSLGGNSSDNWGSNSGMMAGGSIGSEENTSLDLSVNFYELTQGEKISEKITGLNGRSVSSILAEWRDTFISIDRDFINEFQHLFLEIF